MARHCRCSWTLVFMEAVWTMFEGWSQCLGVQGQPQACADCEPGPVSQLLANSKLVAVCQLQHCKLTLVPYLEARSGQLRLMGFLIADDLGT